MKTLKQIKLAGRAGAMPARGGSVLILVVGVLALIATVVIVYTTVGQTDKRGGAGTVRQARTADQAEAVAKHLSTLIARGTFKHLTQPDVDARPTAVRVPADYPGVDPYAVGRTPGGVTAYGGNLDALVFNPAGSTAGWPFDSVDPRGATDPWLASAAPERLLGDAIDPAAPWRDMRDWRAISTAGPGGLFVNLVNLRNNFAAESGVGEDRAGKPRLSTGLTLLKPNYTTNGTNVPEQIPPATLDLAVPLPQVSASGALSTVSVVPDLRRDTAVYRPAMFALNQIGMARPVRETRLAAGRTNLARLYDGSQERIVPGDQEYFPNQYADADGDGWADSRWFEMAEATERDSRNEFVTRSLVPGGAALRLFVAARVIDLSGKVNVNTAMQFGSEPDAANPAGFTPADIDLERVLSGQDAGVFPGSSFTGGNPAFYALFSQPRVQFRAGSDDSDPANYALESSYGLSASGAGTNDRREVVGRSAFAALLDARATPTAGPSKVEGGYAGETSIPTSEGFYPPLNLDTSTPGFARQFTLPDGSGRKLFDGNAVHASDRADLYRLAARGGVLAAAAGSVGSGPSEVRTLGLLGRTTPFGTGDELELRTFEGVNDTGLTSAFERVLAGRNTNATNMTPLRSNRPLALERLDRDRVRNQGFPATQNFPGDGFNDPDTAQQIQVDLRRLLTTVSGGRYFTASTVFPPATGSAADQASSVARRAGQLSAGDVPVRADEALARINLASLATDGSNLRPNYAAMSAAAQDLFRAAADSLLPYSGEFSGTQSLWDAETNAQSPTNAARTLAYGGYRTAADAGGTLAPKQEDYRGSAGETAIRLAAHWTANLVASRLQWTNPVPASRTADAARGVEAADLPVVFTVVSGPQDSPEGLGTAVRELLNRGSALWPGSPSVSMFPEWTAEQADTFGGADANVRLLAPRVAGRLDLGDDRLARANTGGTPRWSPATRVFGITPQPFITQVASTVIYVGFTETNAATSADEAFIDGSRAAGAKSYVGQMVVFAIHNPFDVELSLSKLEFNNTSKRIVNAASGASVQPSELRHYLEFGGHKYALARGPLSGAGGALENILLPPGRTVRVFIADQSPAEMAARLSALGHGATEPQVKNWLRVLLGLPKDGTDDTDFVRLAAMSDDLASVAGTQPAIFSTTAQQNRVAKLWKVVRAQSESSANNPLNDILLDRIRDPKASGSTLDRALSTSRKVKIAGTTQGGQVLVRAASFSRPGGITAVRGALPSYCLEVKVPESAGGLDARYSGVASLNVDYQLKLTATDAELDGTGAGPPDVQDADFPTSTTNAFINKSISAVLGAAAGTLTVPDASKWTIDQDPRDYANGGLTTRRNLSGLTWFVGSSRTPTTAAESGTPRAWTGFIEVPMLLPPVRQSGSLSSASSNAPLGSAVTVAPLFNASGQGIEAKPVPPPLRASDLINTLAIGPSHDPLRARTQGASDYENPEHQDVQWTTLAEAMALALDYDSPAQSNASSDPVDPMYRVGGVDPRWFPLQAAATPPAPLVLGVLVKGRLALDRFVPFVDRTSSNGGGPDGIFDPTIDRVRGLGLPLAVNLLDRVRVGPTGSLTQKVPGTVNVNTAPQAVLAALPLAAPSTRLGDWPAAASNPQNRLVSPENELWDITGTLVGYRDKRVGFALSTSLGMGNGAWVRSDFSNEGALTDELIPAPTGFVATNPATWQGRYFASGILGVRETLGFAAPGELLAARLRHIAGRTEIDESGNEARRQVSIDRQARSGLRPRELGNFNASRPVTGVYAGVYANGIPATKPTALAAAEYAAADMADAPSASQPIADALMGTVNTRSDVFCAWFLIHGYSAADVTGLAPTQPMRPSLAKRYVMVVDRSNVVTTSDRPRVLLFQEVPVLSER